MPPVHHYNGVPDGSHGSRLEKWFGVKKEKKRKEKKRKKNVKAIFLSFHFLLLLPLFPAMSSAPAGLGANLDDPNVFAILAKKYGIRVILNMNSPLANRPKMDPSSVASSLPLLPSALCPHVPSLRH